uniref:C-type lectin domain-containing protein n=1 Tax=Athene cunicularia TaxID=194338 RepID=A0A663N960_ATHCN
MAKFRCCLKSLGMIQPWGFGLFFFFFIFVAEMEIMAELKLLRSNYSENQAKGRSSDSCSAGWKVFEKSCYFFSTETMSWVDAKEICADQGAHLVIVNSEMEQVSWPLVSEK